MYCHPSLPTQKKIKNKADENELSKLLFMLIFLRIWYDSLAKFIYMTYSQNFIFSFLSNSFKFGSVSL